MSRGLSDREQVIKEELFNHFVDLSTATRRLFAEDVDRVKVLREMLGGKERQVAISILANLGSEELRELFGELVFLASFSHGSIQKVREAILKLPRDWVLNRIEGNAEGILADGTDDDYRRLLELYTLIDRTLARKLATRALAQEDPDIKEVGEDFLHRLDDESNGTPNRNGIS